MKELLAYVDGPEATEARAKKAASRIVEWTLTYHVISGMLPTEKIPAIFFPKTFVHSAAFANVSGGQRLHVTKEGGKVTIYSAIGNNATVTQADLKFDGGVIHLIDDVLALPVSPITTATTVGLTALVKNLETTALTNKVEAMKNITIFAPTNTAFEKTASVLSTLPLERATEALTFHIVKDVAFSNGLKDGQEWRTVQGEKLKVKTAGGEVFVNGAKVVVKDVLTKNGVVHVVDGVLVPSE